MTGSYLLETADIEWQHGVPRSRFFDDIYWHRGGAIAEKQHVFIEPLMQLAASASLPVTACELGFGFGINCLLAAEAWLNSGSPAQLNLVSFEKHPVDPAILRQHLSQYDFQCTDRLLDRYPPPVRGHHVIWLTDNVRLLLILDDVESALPNLDALVDFWFLDGFAPARNESMWQPRLFRQMFSRSRPGARIATYSAAGHVRRGLEQAGFVTEKLPGFSHKKEMLAASRPGDWHPRDNGHQSTAIVGTGLAGLYCAEAFARRGLSCLLIDSGGPAASAIPQLTVKPQLAARPETRYRFSLSATQYMRSSPGYRETGVAWQGRNSDEVSRLHRISELFPDDMIETGNSGEVIFHHAGWLSFNTLQHDLCADITSDRIQKIGDDGSGWLLTGEKNSYQVERVILAAGFNRSLLPPELQIRAIHGQALTVPTRGVDQVFNGQVTIFPTVDGQSVVSGTYARRDSLDVDPADTRTLINGAKRIIDFNEAGIETYTGIRAVSRDRLPVVGEMPDWSMLGDANRLSAVTAFRQGLFLCTAFGSRGASHARLCAEHLVSKILGEPAALGLKEQRMLAAGRFYLRDRR